MPFGCWFPWVKTGMGPEAAADASKVPLWRMLRAKTVLMVGAGRAASPGGLEGEVCCWGWLSLGKCHCWVQLWLPARHPVPILPMPDGQVTPGAAQLPAAPRESWGVCHAVGSVERTPVPVALHSSQTPGRAMPGALGHTPKSCHDHSPLSSWS